MKSYICENHSTVFFLIQENLFLGSHHSKALNSARKHKNRVFIEVVVDKYDYGLFEHPKNKKQK